MLKRKIYWYVDYQTSEGIEIEFTCLKKHRIPIVFEGDTYCIIEDTINKTDKIQDVYRTKNLVPYVNLRPLQSVCSEQGFPCSECDRNCQVYGECIFYI